MKKSIGLLQVIGWLIMFLVLLHCMFTIFILSFLPHPGDTNNLIPFPSNNNKINNTDNIILSSLDSSLTKGKEPLIQILQEANIINSTTTTTAISIIQRLPTWEQIFNRLIGSKTSAMDATQVQQENTKGEDGTGASSSSSPPYIIGLETCEEYRNMFTPPKRYIAPAGIFGSGTNLLAELLSSNCKIDKTTTFKNNSRTRRENGMRWQVNWGKHQPAQYRLTDHSVHDEIENRNFLPIIIIRDPYSWMQSMCRRRYSAHWFHNSDAHCPNLIANENDYYWYNQTVSGKVTKRKFRDPWVFDNMNDLANFSLTTKVVPLRVRFKSGTHYHKSLLDLWNKWYGQYYYYHYDENNTTKPMTKFPRLMVRLEDLIFYTKDIITKICSCAGGKILENADHKFKYFTESARKGSDDIHGPKVNRTNYLNSIFQFYYEDRTKGMTTDDKIYTKDNLDPELMKIFHYDYIL